MPQTRIMFSSLNSPSSETFFDINVGAQGVCLAFHSTLILGNTREQKEGLENYQWWVFIKTLCKKLRLCNGM